MIPQIIYLALLFIGVGIAISKHGTTEKKEHNAVVDIIAMFIVLGLLVWGGFFDPMFR